MIGPSFARLPQALVALPLVALLATGLIGCGNDDTGTSEQEKGRCSYDDSSAPVAGERPPRPPADPPTDLPEEVTIGTDQGDLKVALDPDKAPCTVNSFLSLAKAGYYDDTECHRLVASQIFVLQCGDPSGQGSGGPGYRFGDELIDNDPRVSNCRQVQTDQGEREFCDYPAGTLAMANSGPDTNGSQFFLVYQDSPLPPDYTVFGRMSAGAVAVVRKIAAGGNVKNGVAPATTTTITSIT